LILTLFIALIIISILLIVISQYIGSPPLQLGAYTTLFILGIILLSGGVAYESGETKNYTYVCVCCTNGTINYGETQGVCSGTPADCDYYDGFESACILNGCSYDLDLCSGTPNDCDTYTDWRSCTSATCTWEYVSGCEQGSTIELNNETTTATYTNYSGEIYQGVMVHHLIGFIISILASMGFILVFMNLDRFSLNTEQDAFREYRGQKGGGINKGL